MNQVPGAGRMSKGMCGGPGRPKGEASASGVSTRPAGGSPCMGVAVSEGFPRPRPRCLLAARRGRPQAVSRVARAGLSPGSARSFRQNSGPGGPQTPAGLGPVCPSPLWGWAWRLQPQTSGPCSETCWVSFPRSQATAVCPDPPGNVCISYRHLCAASSQHHYWVSLRLMMN